MDHSNLIKDLWESQDSIYFINPKLTESTQNLLLDRLKPFYDIEESHIWLTSSGTTTLTDEDIKWIAISKKAFLNSASQVNKHLNITAKDSWALALPIFHVGGLSIYARAFLSQSKVFVFDSKWDANSFIDFVQKNEITLTSIVPSQLYDLVQTQKQAPASLRAVVIGGGALDPDLYFKARALGWPVLPSYGCTEASSQIATACLESLKDPQVYPKLKLLPDTQAKLVHGKLAIYSRALFTGWVTNDSNRNAIFKDPKEVCWFITEDYGSIENETFIKVDGRGDDFCKVLGENVSLVMLENRWTKLFDETEIAIVALSDERRGSKLVLVTTKKDPKKLEVFNQNSAPFEKLLDVIEVEKIPRTELGKVKRRELSIFDQKAL